MAQFDRSDSMNIKQVCSLLGVGRRCVWHWWRYGGLPTRKAQRGPARLIRVGDLVDWITSREHWKAEPVSARVKELQRNGVLPR